MGYVTYEFYRTEYMGAEITDEADFERSRLEAEAYIDRITMGGITDVTDAVKNAVCAVAEIICRQTHDEESVIASESVGNHSRNYTKTAKTESEREAEKYRKASLYLSRTGLLYRGLR